MAQIRTVSLAAVVLVGALALAGCSASPDSGYVPADPYGTAEAPAGGADAADPVTPASDAPTPGADEIALIATDVPDLGTIVTDAAGFTLYRFDEDSADPAESTCVDACAAKWPPYVVNPTGSLTIDGVEESAVGKVKRPDGTVQLTIEGWPVYRFAADPDAGSTEGQGVGGTWFAVTPEGKKAALAP